MDRARCSWVPRFWKTFGAGGFGLDYDQIMKTVEFWSPYPGPGDEILRSIAPAGFTRSNWFGYSKGVEPILRKYWRIVTRGCDSVWWWMWPNIGTFNGLLRPTLEPYPAILEMNRKPDRETLEDAFSHLDGRDERLLRWMLQTSDVLPARRDPREWEP